MRVAVVIPTLNESGRVAASIGSAWDAGADEVIVVDGESSDDTLLVASPAATRVLVTGPGRGQQQNAGAGATTADWLLFLHADNRLASGAIEQLRHAADRPDVLCGAYQQCIEAPGHVYRLLERGNARRVRWRGLPYGDQAIFVRRDCFQAIGGFPETPLMEDYILMKRLRRRAWPILLAGPVYVSARRWQHQGVIRQTLRNWTIIVAYELGVSPQRLARMYYSKTTNHRSTNQPTAMASVTREERPG